MLVIGSDLHKKTHSCAAVSTQTGELKGQTTAKANSEGYAELLEWAKSIDEDRVWALEDCRHVSAGFELFLLSHGEKAVRVAPHLTAQKRRNSRSRGKTDPIDAVAIARAALAEGIDSLPEVAIDERAADIKLLVDHRDNLVRARTQNQNRLRDDIHHLWPDLELPAGCLDRAKWIDILTGKLRRAKRTVRVRIALEILAQIKRDNKAISKLTAEIEDLVNAYAPQLLTEPGCGPLTAGKLIAEIAGIDRFCSDAKLARMAGIAPIPASSGKTVRHRLDRQGNRQLNAAIHRIALVKAKHDPQTREYLARLRAQGKTKLESLRCLKRHLIRRIFKLLTHKNPQIATIPQTSG